MLCMGVGQAQATQEGKDRFFVWHGGSFEDIGALQHAFCTRQVVAERIAFHGHPYGFCESLEDGFDLMVFIITAALDMQVASRGIAE
jgi:hypothetical protein